MTKYMIVLIFGICFMNASRAQERGAINNAESPHVKLRSVNIGDCRWTQGFWADKFELCAKVMVPHMGQILKGDIGHAYNNFKIAAGLREGEHRGMRWHDGDFYKWMESAAYVYAINKDPKILQDPMDYDTYDGKGSGDHQPRRSGVPVAGRRIRAFDAHIRGNSLW